eukprot:5830841-Amphidinium_carterae.2
MTLNCRGPALPFSPPFVLLCSCSLATLGVPAPPVMSPVLFYLFTAFSLTFTHHSNPLSTHNSIGQVPDSAHVHVDNTNYYDIQNNLRLHYN